MSRGLVLGLLVASLAAMGNGSLALAQNAPAACGLVAPAFCETFATASKLDGRTGPLDPRRWSVARVSGIDNPSQGMVDEFPSTALVSCKDPAARVLPDADFVLCDDHGADSTHLAEALNDGGSYVYKAARIRQPFDFADRTGTLAFDVNAQTDGEHSYWVEMWITDEPIPGPHADSSGSASLPRNGLGLEFSQNCGHPDTAGGLHYVSIVRDFVSHTNIVDREGFPSITTHGVPVTLPQAHGYSWRAVSIPVALDELTSGDNTLELASADQVSVANVDVTIDRE